MGLEESVSVSLKREGVLITLNTSIDEEISKANSVLEKFPGSWDLDPDLGIVTLTITREDLARGLDYEPFIKRLCNIAYSLEELDRAIHERIKVGLITKLFSITEKLKPPSLHGVPQKTYAKKGPPGFSIERVQEGFMVEINLLRAKIFKSLRYARILIFSEFVPKAISPEVYEDLKEALEKFEAGIYKLSDKELSQLRGIKLMLKF